MRSYFQTIIFLLFTLGANSVMAYDVWLVSNQNRIMVIKDVQSATPTQELNVTHASVPDAFSHDFGDIGFAEDGSLYGISMTFGTQAALYSIDLNTGAISQSPNLFPFEWGNALGFNIATGEGYAGGGLEDSNPYEFLKYFRSFMNHDPATSQIWHDMSGDYPNGGTAGDFALAHGKVYAIWAIFNGGVYEYYLLQFETDGSSYVNLGRADTAIGDPEGIWGLASDGEVLYANSPTALYRVNITGNSASYTKIIDFTLNNNEKINGATSKRADLSLTHIVSDPSPDLDSNITLTTTVQNDGPYDATSVLARVTLPAGYEYIQSNPGSGSYNPGSGEWDIGDLANGTSVTLTMTVTVRTVGTLQSNAEITEAGEGDLDSYVGSSFATDDLNDTITDDDEDTAVVTLAPSMSVSKQVDLSTISLPTTLNYTIDVVNTGNIGLHHITVTDTLPNGQSQTLSTHTGDSDGDNILDENEVWQYHTTYNVTQAEINAGTDIINHVSVTSSETNALESDSAITVIRPYTPTINGYFWLDSDHDGIQDSGETFLGNAVVELLDAQGNPVNDIYGNHTTTTDVQGRYHFDVLPDRTYQIHFIIPHTYLTKNYIFTVMNRDGNTLGSDVDSRGYTQPITVQTGSNYTHYDAGINCGCTGIHTASNGGSALTLLSKFILTVLTLLSALFFSRKEILV